MGGIGDSVARVEDIPHGMPHQDRAREQESGAEVPESHLSGACHRRRR